MTIDDGIVKVRGSLKVYTKNYYTSKAPVWITLDDSVKEYLRGRGGRATLALYVPSTENQKSETTLSMIEANRDPEIVARRKGKVVALLTLRRVR